jgi:hypothetical protein
MPDEQSRREGITVLSLAIVTFGLGLLTILTPFSGTQSPAPRIGGLLRLGGRRRSSARGAAING